MDMDTKAILGSLACGRSGCACVQAVDRGSGDTHCPAHGDGKPSMSVTPGDGKVLVHCNAGCTQDAVIDALRERGLWPKRGSTPREITAAYDYTNPDGKLLFQVVRYEPKQFAVRRSDGGKWIWNLRNIRHVPYRLPELLAAIKAGKTVYIVEGEKDANTLHKVGLVATTNPLGAGKWPMDFGKYFEGAQVVIVPDNDAPGVKHAMDVLKSLNGHAASVVVVNLPDGNKDISEWFAAGGTPGLLCELIAKKTPFVPKTTEPTEPVDGAALLRTLERYFNDYAVLGPGVATTLGLWAMGTWVWDGAFDVFPYLGITSPVMRCGKSKVMKLLRPVVNRPISSAGISPAGLFRTVEAEKPVLLIDEAQRLRQRDDTNADLYDLLCAGYEKGATVIRIGGPNKDETIHFEVYCPKAFALIGKMDDTLSDRSITVRMRRRKKSETIKPFFAIKAAEITDPIRDQLRAWAAPDLKVRVRDVYLKSGGEIMPPAGLDDREADLWFPLFALVRAVDPGRVGEIERIAMALSTEKGTEGDAISLRLLADVRGVWPAGQDFISTTDLLKLLLAVPDAPWTEYGRRSAPITGRGLADLLRPFDIYAGKERAEGYTPGTRGYSHRDFEEAWETYLDDPEPDPDEPNLPTTLVESATSATPATNGQKPSESEVPPRGTVALRVGEGEPDQGLPTSHQSATHHNVADEKTLDIPGSVAHVAHVADIQRVMGKGEVDTAGDGARVYAMDLLASSDWPRIEVGLGESAGPGQAAWERYLHDPGVLGRAVAAIQAYVTAQDILDNPPTMPDELL